MFKYFIKTKYPSKESLKAEFMKMDRNDRNKYPLISQLLFYESSPQKLKYLPFFNEFCNSLINYYSFKITRDKAKEDKIENILEKDNLFNNEKLEKFIEIFNEVKEDAIYYKEWKMEVK